MKAAIIVGGMRNARVVRRTLEGNGAIRRCSIGGKRAFCALKPGCKVIWQVVKTEDKKK